MITFRISTLLLESLALRVCRFRFRVFRNLGTGNRNSPLATDLCARGEAATLSACPPPLLAAIYFSSYATQSPRLMLRWLRFAALLLIGVGAWPLLAGETVAAGRVPAPSATCKPVNRPPAPAPAPLPRGITFPPHIVSILVDDLGFDDLRSHDLNSGAPSFTPTVAQLLKDGVLLSRHHTYMWCSPSRRSFITGRYIVHITGEQAETDTNLTPAQSPPTP